jgi:single-strand DNA-binding protein
MNKTMLIGRLVTTPELTKTSTDKSVLRSKIAVNRRFKNANGEKEADFISLVIWGKTAETFVSYAKKGMLISVEGEIRTRSYQDKQAQKHYVTEVLVQSFELLESRATIAMRQGNIVDSDDLDLDLAAEELPF